MNRRSLLGLALCAWAALGACGGKVVVDAPGTGAGGGSGGGSANDCTSLEQALTTAIAAAQKCDSLSSTFQCGGVVTDSCGCEEAANDTNPATIQAAQSAYQAWTSAGCGPVPCATCPPSPSWGLWTCQPSMNSCMGPMPM
jgi:hypothetical protein